MLSVYLYLTEIGYTTAVLFRLKLKHLKTIFIAVFIFGLILIFFYDNFSLRAVVDLIFPRVIKTSDKDFFYISEHVWFLPQMYFFGF